MSDDVKLLSEIERRNDDIRLAEQARRGEHIPTGPILQDELVTLLRETRKRIKVWRSLQTYKAIAASRKSLLTTSLPEGKEAPAVK